MFLCCECIERFEDYFFNHLDFDNHDVRWSLILTIMLFDFVVSHAAKALAGDSTAVQVGTIDVIGGTAKDSRRPEEGDSTSVSGTPHMVYALFDFLISILPITLECCLDV